MDLRDFYGLMQKNGMSVPPVAEWLAKVSDNSELWPIMREGKSIGGVLFIGHTVHIVVDPEWHGRWVTKQLRRIVLEQWANEVPIETVIKADNQPSIRLAQAAGFEFAGDQGIYHRYVRPSHHALQQH